MDKLNEQNQKVEHIFVYYNEYVELLLRVLICISLSFNNCAVERSDFSTIY